MAEIISQNQSLLEIANNLSHEYRKPVASILGLMNLIKHDDYKSDKESLIMMESATKELDVKLRKIISYIEVL
ncbi:HAMP domain-containing histidine kinase [Pedobacter sp. L105]|uniref:HAMP domain-containing histidine kinase n=1 Tax=Pedobacter sp. L105 TaxID=1641871 RepID=UPI001576D1CB|nr:HAMP domain-containing histidine kinase [Pedobacter sp. L105]